MTDSFPLAQPVYGRVGPYPGVPTATFPNPVGYGNIVVAVFEAWYPGNPGPGLPTTPTDNQGNTYLLVSQGQGFAGSTYAQLYMWVAIDVLGGPLTVTFNGLTGTVGLNSGPSLFLAEYECPGQYSIFGIGAWQPGTSPTVINCTDNSGSGSAAQCQVSFRFMANNGGLGGGSCSDTGNGSTSAGVLSLTVAPSGGYAPDWGTDTVGMALVNEFIDVLVILAGYNGAAPGSPYWHSISGATIEAITFEPTGGGGFNDGTSGVYADQNFPYLNGPLQADCDSPPDGTVGVAYSHYLVASGGIGPPYTFTQVGGILPPGLTLTSSGTDAGLISGTPTAAGRFEFTVDVSDGSSNYVLDCVIAICPSCGTGAGNYGFSY